MSASQILMIGTSTSTMGGISSVVKVYQAQGLFERWPIRYLATHRDGTAAQKLQTALSAFAAYLVAMLFARPRLVHVHLSSRASFWRKSGFLAVAWLLRVPYLIHLHGSEFQIFYERESGRTVQRLVSFFFDRAACVIVLSAHWREWVQGMSANPRVVPIYNPVVFERRPPSASRTPGVVLFLGRLGKRKGSYDLLEAVRRLSPRFPQLKVLLGGDGEVEQVRARAAELGISNHVELLGWVDGARKQQLLAQASVYALPSYNEGLPMSVLEAMSAGLAVVSTKVGGIPEAVRDGQEGLLIEAGDVDALTDALGLMLADPARTARMGEAARERVDRVFSADRLVPEVEAIYASFGCHPQS